MLTLLCPLYILFPWNVRLSHLGGIIASLRSELIDELNEDITDAYRRVSDGKEQILLKYKPSADLNTYESQLINKLEQAMDLDLIRGFTSYGLIFRQDSCVAARENRKALIDGLAQTILPVIAHYY